MFQLVFQAISTGTMGFHGTSACACGCGASRRNLGCSGSNSRRSGALAMAPGVALKSGVFTDVEEGFKVPRLQCWSLVDLLDIDQKKTWNSSDTPCLSMFWYVFIFVLLQFWEHDVHPFTFCHGSVDVLWWIGGCFSIELTGLDIGKVRTSWSYWWVIYPMGLI
jgi:hypothetical protein